MTRTAFSIRRYATALAAVAVAIALLGGCHRMMKAVGMTPPVPEIRPGVPDGYLPANQIPDSLALVPPPPAAGSPGFANDEAVGRAAYALRDTPRWRQARLDADLSFPRAAGTFACALGVRIDATTTPVTYRLLQRTKADASRAVRAAKQHYRRPRPFMLNNQPSCTPQDEAELRDNGSYPSGHTSIGWTWALVLAEIAPERATAVLARGRSYGENRLVCNVHWQSDVLQGRFMASSLVARLHNDPTFRADLEAARSELDNMRAQGVVPDRDCAGETTALAQKIPGVQ